MEAKDMDNLIRKAMAVDAMGINEPDARLVSEARRKVMARKKQPDSYRGENPSVLSAFFMLLRYRLKFYQVGVSVLVTCVCLFYSIEMNVQSRSGQSLGAEHANILSIKNTTISVNSSTILTSIPTLRN
jgi:hypothetical protein